jgi:hypothetical protein
MDSVLLITKPHDFKLLKYRMETGIPLALSHIMTNESALISTEGGECAYSGKEGAG